jgi:ubiquinone/menaquinone biosynthesis C-methylase UbiE
METNDTPKSLVTAAQMTAESSRCLSNLLRCPSCHSSITDVDTLNWDAAKGSLTGHVTCAKCGHEMPTTDGVLYALSTDLKQQSFIDSRNSVVFTETWKRFPQNYNETHLSEEYDILEKWKGHFQQATILDVGCGSGRLMEVWARFGFEFVIFVDISDAIFKAKKLYEENFKDQFNAIFIRANLKNIPLESQSVDMACSNGVIHHTDNQSDALSDVFRVTRNTFFLGVISEKTIIGQAHILPNLIKPVINRMSNFDYLYRLTTVITAIGMGVLKFLYYTGIYKFTSLKTTLPRLIQDKNGFAKLKFCLFDVLLAPTYTKHSDEFYEGVARSGRFNTVQHTTSSMFDYFCFERFGADTTFANVSQTAGL